MLSYVILSCWCMFRGRRRDRHGDEVVDSDEDTGGNIQKKKRGRKRNVNEEGAPRAKRCVCAHSCMHVCVCVSVCMHVLPSCHHHFLLTDRQAPPSSDTQERRGKKKRVVSKAFISDSDEELSSEREDTAQSDREEEAGGGLEPQTTETTQSGQSEDEG